MKYCIILLTLLISCTKTSDNSNDKKLETEENIPELLDGFSLNRTSGFTAIKNNDAIALDLKRIDHGTMEYRIEISRNWKTSTVDHGVVKIKQIVSEDEIDLTENIDGCELLVKVLRDSLTGDVFAQVRRECSDTTKNIGTEEFPHIRSK